MVQIGNDIIVIVVNAFAVGVGYATIRLEVKHLNKQMKGLGNGENGNGVIGKLRKDLKEDIADINGELKDDDHGLIALKNGINKFEVNCAGCKTQLTDRIGAVEKQAVKNETSIDKNRDDIGKLRKR